MATLKDDDDSWKASGLKRKREDWENKEPQPRFKSKKKNTKKWCKGKVGVEHDVQNVPVVHLTPLCIKSMNGQRYPNGSRIYCGHWRHYETKCVNCGKSSYHVVKSQRPDNKKQKELEKKWCSEGHLYDWVEIHNTWLYGGREIQTCVMCGKTKGKSRKKMDG